MSHVFLLLLLREYVPLKQGLRLTNIKRSVLIIATPRVCSTKTRIKTYALQLVWKPRLSPRVCSTKTRIKTTKRLILYILRTTPRVCSTKTRIKTNYPRGAGNKFTSPRVCSTKTRIKTYTSKFDAPVLDLREYVPLKQGLRLLFGIWEKPAAKTPRVCSTKTRIKTPI